MAKEGNNFAPASCQEESTGFLTGERHFSPSCGRFHQRNDGNIRASSHVLQFSSDLCVKKAMYVTLRSLFDDVSSEFTRSVFCFCVRIESVR